MIHRLCGMFKNQARTERYNISKIWLVYKLSEGSPVSPHLIKMMGYIDTLDKLGCELKDDLATDVILQSLPVSYEMFIMNFHISDMKKTMAELHGMLKIAKDSIMRKANHVTMVQKEEKKRKLWTTTKGNGKKKFSVEPSSSKPKTKGKSGPSPDE
jgi:hypothetical protein